MSALAEYFVKIRTDTSKLPGDLNAVKSMVTSSLQQIASTAAGVLTAAGIGSLMNQVKSLGSAFVTTNAKVENYTLSLGVLLKSQDAAIKMIGDIEKMASTTPFSTDSLTAAVVQMKAFGFETERILPMLRTIGDAAAASPGGMEQGLQRITYALGQIRASGRLLGGDALQLTSAGLPVYEILAQRMGKTIAEVKKLGEQGALESGQVIDNLLAGMDSRFSGMMDKQSKSFAGLWSTLQDGATMAIRQIGKPIFELAKVKLDNLVAWLDTPMAKDGVKRFADGLAGVVEFSAKLAANPLARDVAGILAFGAAINLLKAPLTGVLGLLSPFAGGLKAILAAAAPLVMASGPFALATVALGGLALAFVSARNDGLSFKEALADIAGQMIGVGKAATRLAQDLDFNQRIRALTEQIEAVGKGREGREAAKDRQAAHERRPEHQAGAAAAARFDEDIAAAKAAVDAARKEWAERKFAFDFGGGRDEKLDMDLAASKMEQANQKMNEMRQRQAEARAAAERQFLDKQRVAEKRPFSSAIDAGIGAVGQAIQRETRFGIQIGGGLAGAGLGAVGQFGNRIGAELDAMKQAAAGKMLEGMGLTGKDIDRGREQTERRKLREQILAEGEKAGIDRDILDRMMPRDPEDEKAKKNKDPQTEFVGLAEFSRKIQASLTASPEEKKAEAESLTDIIRTGIDEGLTSDQLAKRIQKTLGGETSKARAKAIARTETTGAMNQGHNAGLVYLQQEGLISGKTWLSISDDRRRESHRELNEVTVAANESFDVGGNAAPYPGHHSLPAEERVNCRCTIVSKMEGL